MVRTTLRRKIISGRRAISSFSVTLLVASTALSAQASPSGIEAAPAAEVSETTQALLAVGTEAVGLGDLAGLEISIEELTSTATRLADGTPEGAFTIEGLQVLLTGSLVDDVVAQVDEALAPVLDQLATLGGLLGVEPNIENPLESPLAITDVELTEAAGVESLSDLPAGTDLVPHLVGAVLALLTGTVDDIVEQLRAVVEQMKESPQFGTVCNPPVLPPNPLCGLLDTVVETVATTLADLLETLSESVLATLTDTLSQLLALPVGTETLGEDGTFGISALSAALGPEGALGQLDLATSTLAP